ncbi:calcineurin-like phosphoesterase family protein [Rhizobium sp. PP-F2F-G38]|nr:calcineurin-like phosphoesterase family protein [Rhizobium sp. PP-F2F-G38]
MPAIFVHVSDTHFGLDAGKGSRGKNDDIKERLLEDVRDFFRQHETGRATGILFAGDLANKGKAEEYADAGKWLDRLTNAAGCRPHRVQVVPGNHDVNREMATSGVRLMMDHVASGNGKLADFLEHEHDRRGFYRRFDPYSEFAEAYDCSVDESGGPVGVWRVPIGSKRKLKILGLNSAILCRKADKAGDLLLGPYQSIIDPPHQDEFIVVMVHHPLKWMGDGGEILKYIKARASVLITAHEHSNKSEIVDGILNIDAGAVIQPSHHQEPQRISEYTYNIIEFSGAMGAKDAALLKVKVHPRIWSDETTRFDAGETREFELEARPPRVDFSRKANRRRKSENTNEVASVIYEFFRMSPDQRGIVLKQYQAVLHERSTRMDRQVLDSLLTSVGATEMASTLEKVKNGTLKASSPQSARPRKAPPASRGARGRRTRKKPVAVEAK